MSTSKSASSQPDGGTSPRRVMCPVIEVLGVSRAKSFPPFPLVQRRRAPLLLVVDPESSTETARQEPAAVRLADFLAAEFTAEPDEGWDAVVNETFRPGEYALRDLTDRGMIDGAGDELEDGDAAMLEKHAKQYSPAGVRTALSPAWRWLDMRARLWDHPAYAGERGPSLLRQLQRVAGVLDDSLRAMYPGLTRASRRAFWESVEVWSCLKEFAHGQVEAGRFSEEAAADALRELRRRLGYYLRALREPGTGAAAATAQPAAGKPRRRYGFEADAKRHEAIAKIVAEYGDHWKDDENLPEVRKQLYNSRQPYYARKGGKRNESRDRDQLWITTSVENLKKVVVYSLGKAATHGTSPQA